MAREPRKFSSATAFRRALEDRLKRTAKTEKLDLQRLMRGAAFDRLLARLFSRTDAPWVLKGGYALELRIKEARATRDLDLALREALGAGRGGSVNDAIFAALESAAGRDLEDFFSFIVAPAMMELDGAPYGGARFPVDARIDGRSRLYDAAQGDQHARPGSRGYGPAGPAGIGRQEGRRRARRDFQAAQDSPDPEKAGGASRRLVGAVRRIGPGVRPFNGDRLGIRRGRTILFLVVADGASGRAASGRTQLVERKTF